MSQTDLPVVDNDQTPFERIRQEDADGVEFWSARELMPILEYVSWQKENVKSFV
jgi:DNA-damage-inducible protein D